MTPSLVTKGSLVPLISSKQTLVQILNLGCDPDHDHSNPIFPQDALAYDDLPLKFSCQIIASSEDTVLLLVQTVIFWLHDNPSLDLHLEDSTPCFLADTPQSMMLQHYTRFGYKRCCGSEDSLLTNNRNFKPSYKSLRP